MEKLNEQDIKHMVRECLNRLMLTEKHETYYEDEPEFTGDNEEAIKNALQRLSNGEDLESVFDKVSPLMSGNSVVKLNNKWNLANKDGEIISKDLWFDDIEPRSSWFIIVRVGKKYNILNSKGILVSKDLWFDSISDFIGPMAIIKLNKKWNFLTTLGNVIHGDKTNTDTWYDKVWGFDMSLDYGLALVKLGDKYNFINYMDKPLSKKWFDDAGFFDETGYAEVILNGEKLYINTDGKITDHKRYSF